ncbi:MULTISPECIES: ABC transporter substrate-binding protein [unclassified Haladaptatus]|uniref:ABC transporter substrate-binding protein n=1 Tax=unclassified Haladaptatus TaxID=2622732 RepID=UPI0023E8962E|nr:MULTISPECIES: ABC transporter substrate-binding protein [unclassified Haladaptatus]
MAPNNERRKFLKGLGAAGIAGLAGCIGSPGDDGTTTTGDGGGNGTGTTDGGGGNGGGDGGPDIITVIGYPESGIQLFRDYYNLSDGSEQILVPDGLQSTTLPDQVGNDMANVTGTAPAAGGPNQEAFSQLFQDEFNAAPSVFTSQSYDSVALLILANVAAGENNGTSIRDQMRRVANPEGEEFGPANLSEAVEAVAAGDDINYQGASSATNFNELGDPASAAYSIWEFDRANQTTPTLETQSFEGDNPEGSGAMADSAPGGTDREVKVGILLPETGDLAAVGRPMISAARLPALQINDANPAGISVDAQVEDTQTSPDSGVAAAQSLVNAGYPAVCGSASSGVNVPVSQQVFIPNQVVGCSPSSTALSVSNLDDDDYIFRTAPSDFLQGRVMAQVASERLGGASAATLFVNNDYGQQLSDRFADVFESQFGGTITNKVAFNIGESSYTSVIEQVLGQ